MDVIPMKPAVSEVHTAFPPYTQKPIKKKKQNKKQTTQTISAHTLITNDSYINR